MEARVERVWTPTDAEQDADTGELDAVEDTLVEPSVAEPSVAEPSVAEHRDGAANAWLIGDDDEVIVIDPGEDADAVLEQVGDREILAVICTHGHAAHIAAAIEVAERDESEVALHRSDLLLWRMVHDDEAPEIEMADGGRFDVSDVQLEVVHTAGHTPGSVSLYCADLEVVFTGDALTGRGPVPHEGEFADFPRQLTAIGERLLDLPPQTRVLPGHGAECTIGDAAKKFDGWVVAGPAGDFS